MRRFAGFLVAAMLAAFILGAFRAEARDDQKKVYDCEVCDDAAYKQSASHAMVYFHAAGVNSGSAHRTTMFEWGGGSGFVFVDADGKKRICTALHVLQRIQSWDSGNLTTCLWNMKDRVIVRVARYSETRDLAVLDFAEPDYVYSGDALELGDSDELKPRGWLTAIGAPKSHCFMQSRGPFLGFVEGDEGILMFCHLAKTTHGNSGGPVLNSDGKVVGISIAIHADEKKGTYCWSIAARVNDLKELLAREKEKEKEDEEK